MSDQPDRTLLYKSVWSSRSPYQVLGAEAELPPLRYEQVKDFARQVAEPRSSIDLDNSETFQEAYMELTGESWPSKRFDDLQSFPNDFQWEVKLLGGQPRERIEKAKGGPQKRLQTASIENVYNALIPKLRENNILQLLLGDVDLPDQIDQTMPVVSRAELDQGEFEIDRVEGSGDVRVVVLKRKGKQIRKEIEKALEKVLVAPAREVAAEVQQKNAAPPAKARIERQRSAVERQKSAVERPIQPTLFAGEAPLEQSPPLSQNEQFSTREEQPIDVSEEMLILRSQITLGLEQRHSEKNNAEEKQEIVEKSKSFQSADSTLTPAPRLPPYESSTIPPLSKTVDELKASLSKSIQSLLLKTAADEETTFAVDDIAFARLGGVTYEGENKKFSNASTYVFNREIIKVLQSFLNIFSKKQLIVTRRLPKGLTASDVVKNFGLGYDSSQSPILSPAAATYFANSENFNKLPWHTTDTYFAEVNENNRIYGETLWVLRPTENSFSVEGILWVKPWEDTIYSRILQDGFLYRAVGEPSPPFSSADKEVVSLWTETVAGPKKKDNKKCDEFVNAGVSGPFDAGALCSNTLYSQVCHVGKTMNPKLSAALLAIGFVLFGAKRSQVLASAPPDMPFAGGRPDFETWISDGMGPRIVPNINQVLTHQALGLYRTFDFRQNILQDSDRGKLKEDIQILYGGKVIPEVVLEQWTKAPAYVAEYSLCRTDIDSPAFLPPIEADLAKQLLGNLFFNLDMTFYNLFARSESLKAQKVVVTNFKNLQTSESKYLQKPTEWADDYHVGNLGFLSKESSYGRYWSGVEDFNKEKYTKEEYEDLPKLTQVSSVRNALLSPRLPHYLMYRALPTLRDLYGFLGILDNLPEAPWVSDQKSLSGGSFSPSEEAQDEVEAAYAEGDVVVDDVSLLGGEISARMTDILNEVGKYDLDTDLWELPANSLDSLFREATTRSKSPVVEIRGGGAEDLDHSSAEALIEPTIEFSD